MAELNGNLLVAQSGGPTCAINASIVGVIQEAGRHDCIEEIYGGLNGVYGILREDIIDINDEKAKTIDMLKYSPAAALGTCRYKIDFKKKPEKAAKDMDRLFQIFEAHNIRYFFYAGGNDSQDTSHKIHLEAIKRGFELHVIGIPKTIDNDLPHTDYCPGYGSVVKYNATTVMEVGIDVGCMATDDGSCCIIEVMGRSAGWIAAGTVIAKRKPEDPPHIILLPEIVFEEEKFLAKVKEVVSQYKYCIVVAGEGIKNASGNEIGADDKLVDAFGHKLLSGAADKLAQIVQNNLGTKTRTVKLGYAQRAAGHFASLTDIKNAVMVGGAAVKAAVEGKSGFMVKIIRNVITDDNGKQRIEWGTDLQPLEDIANAERLVPRDWLSEDGFMPNEKMVEYARPLVEGELPLPIKDGLPCYYRLEKSLIEKKLPPMEA